MLKTESKTKVLVESQHYLIAHVVNIKSHVPMLIKQASGSVESRAIWNNNTLKEPTDSHSTCLEEGDMLRDHRND